MSNAPPTKIVSGEYVCASCGYDLRELPPSGPCPECGAPIAQSMVGDLTRLGGVEDGRVIVSRPCNECGYDLRGISADGPCPECGTPVLRSLRGDLLEFASTAYVRNLYSGLRFVLNGILLMIVSLVGSVAGGVILATGVGVATAAISGAQLAYAASVVAVYFGWWKLSAPDPSYEGRNSGQTPRRIVRITAMFGVIATLVSTVFGMISQAMGSANSTMTAIGLIAILLTLTMLVANVVAFFAQMLLIKWLAPRVPNEKARKRAGTLMWLVPVLVVFGALLLYIGPLIALILYWNMLDWIRKDLRKILERMSEREGLPQPETI